MATMIHPSVEEQELPPSTDTFRELEDSDDAHRADTDDNKVKEDFHQFLDNLPEELKGQIDPSQVKKAYENAKDFKILVTGKTGSGKSTLINGILGVSITEDKKAEEGDSISAPCTTEVTEYHITKGSVDITIWDSPGLQDGTDNERYLQQMSEKCGERYLTMYCIDVQQKKFLSGGDDNPDVVAMKKLTRKFGHEFWNNTVIVLTFFNCIADDVKIKYLKIEEKTKAVEAKLQEWKNQIVHILTHDVKIDQQVAEKIVIVPAGYYLEPHLPVCNYWLSNIWNHCLAAIPTQEGRLALIKANANRLRTDDDVQEEDFERPIGQQPIVVEKNYIGTVAKVAGVTTFVAGCVAGCVAAVGEAVVAAPAIVAGSAIVAGPPAFVAGSPAIVGGTIIVAGSTIAVVPAAIAATLATGALMGILYLGNLVKNR